MTDTPRAWDRLTTESDTEIVVTNTCRHGSKTTDIPHNE